MSITLLPAVEQLALLNQRKVSPSELAEEYICRIERLNPILNAIVDFDPERIRLQARQEKQGVLAGLPVTVKSSIAAEGHLCELGSRLHRGFRPIEDSEAVSRLYGAGVTLLGTTNCPEFLMAYETDNLLYGRTSNPWSLKRSAGGSSGGEAAAIAAGMSAAGLGSDSGGSVREPAHFCGICALKPTPGRVPARGHIPPCFGPFAVLGAIGPMGRNIADVELLFRVLSAQDPLDPASPRVAYKPVSLDAARAIPIGWFEDDGLIPVTAETRQAVRNAVQSLTRQGFRLEHFRPASLEAARQLWQTFFVQCGAMFLAPMIHGREEQLSPVFKDFLRTARAQPSLTADSLLQAWAECDAVRGRLLDELKDFPVLLCPACAVPAFEHGQRSWAIEDRTVGYWDVMRYTQWFNLLGAPAAIVPAGKSNSGLPIGVQIASRPFEDEAVLTVAAALERDFGYQTPPLANFPILA